MINQQLWSKSCQTPSSLYIFTNSHASWLQWWVMLRPLLAARSSRSSGLLSPTGRNQRHWMRAHDECKRSLHWISFKAYMRTSGQHQVVAWDSASCVGCSELQILRWLFNRLIMTNFVFWSSDIINSALILDTWSDFMLLALKLGLTRMTLMLRSANEVTLCPVSIMSCMGRSHCQAPTLKIKPIAYFCSVHPEQLWRMLPSCLTHRISYGFKMHGGVLGWPSPYFRGQAHGSAGDRSAPHAQHWVGCKMACSLCGQYLLTGSSEVKLEFIDWPFPK